MKSNPSDSQPTQEEQNTPQPEETPEQTAEALDKETKEDNVPEEQSASAAQAAELEELRKQVEEHQQRFLRAQADFDNFRRRSRQEKEDFAKYASAKVIEQLLPIVDNFERALTSSKETKDFEALLKGLEMTARQLEQVLKNEGLQAMETVGQPFNPDFHQAIMQVESEEHGEGIVVEEVQKGYVLKDKVLRPAMVKVSM
ncbi:nucleotide exchange factor GrpE [Paenibacillus aurantius]|uniref:nucleotide exchange factor GrpE n=1 Tax=Paenibacillus aurantius TaxID=2918900 RepID=UPI00387F3B17